MAKHMNMVGDPGCGPPQNPALFQCMLVVVVKKVLYFERPLEKIETVLHRSPKTP